MTAADKIKLLPFSSFSTHDFFYVQVEYLKQMTSVYRPAIAVKNVNHEVTYTAIIFFK